MINQHYKNRYDKFITKIKSSNRTLKDVYTEVHHIQPKCLKGSDNDDNLIELTLREHHLAHWLLWKAYPNYLPISSAFLQMNNKNVKISGKDFKPLPSKVYESLKTTVYSSLSNLRLDKVYVRDDAGALIEMTKEEYAAQTEFKFHTTGKIVVYDKKTDRYKSITTDEYHRNKDRYRPNTLADEIIAGKCQYSFLNVDENTIEKLGRSEAARRNQEAGYKKYKQIIQHKILVKDEDGKESLVDLETYKTGNYRHVNANTVKVYDKELDRHLFIPREDYFKDPNRYLTSTKGKVLVKDANNKSILISKEEFAEGAYSGHTYGLRTMYDKRTNTYVQLTEDEWQADKDRYVGPNKGKVNVINKITGIRCQIAKGDFDKNVYISLGDRSLFFRAKNNLTGKEKNINIYEWDLVKDKYEIIDHEKFRSAMSKKK